MPLLELRSKMLKSNKDKATSPDLISNDSMRLAADEFSMQPHPLVVRMTLFGEEPLALKGGQAVPVYKLGPGSVMETDYRQIFLG